MRNKIVVFTVAIFIVFSLAAELWSQTDTLTIIHVNDSHSHLLPYGPKDAQNIGTRGGIARAASIIGQITMTEENVLFLHAGDVFVGDLMFNKFFGVPELQILAQLGCDALTIGNHEFDLTPDVLKLALSEAGFPIPGFDILSANIDMSQDPVLANFVKPYTIKEVGKVNVGIFGLTTPETNEFSMVAPDSITSFIDGALEAISALESQCDVIIGLTHLGFMVDSILACNVPGIDIIVGGHSHTVLNQPVGITNPLGKTTWIVQAGAFYDYVGSMKLRCGQGDVTIIDYQLIPVDNSVPEEPTIAAVVQSLVDTLEADPRYGSVYSQVIGEAAIDIERDFLSANCANVPIGDLITDAYRDTLKTDIAITVWGFISQKLYSGPLTGSDIFQAVSYGYDIPSGYGFKLMTFELSGLALLIGIETILDQVPQMRDLNIQCSGMTVTHDPGKGQFQKVTVLVGDQPINPLGMYTITTNSGVFDFLSMAGLEPQNPLDPGVLEYVAVRDYIVRNSPISYLGEPRVPVETSDWVSLPKESRLFQNYPNPFNASTTIRFHLAKPDFITLKIFNLMGQEIETLVYEQRPAGASEIVWNTEDLPSGIYLYRLETGAFKETKKLILQK